MLTYTATAITSNFIGRALIFPTVDTGGPLPLIVKPLLASGHDKRALPTTELTRWSL